MPTVRTDVLATLAGDRRVRYVFAGGLSALVYYGLFTAGWFALSPHLPYLIIAIMASTLCAVVTYPVYRSVVFRTGGPLIPGFLRFYVVCVWALVFGLGGLSLLVEAFGMHPLPAQAIVVTLGPLINYQAGRLWAFRSPDEVNPC